MSLNVNRVIYLDEYMKENFSFVSDEMIENKGKIRGRSINHGGPIKSHS